MPTIESLQATKEHLETLRRDADEWMQKVRLNDGMGDVDQAEMMTITARLLAVATDLSIHRAEMAGAIGDRIDIRLSMAVVLAGLVASLPGWIGLVL